MQVFEETKSQIKIQKSIKLQEEMTGCPYQELFPYINDAAHGKGNTKWNEKDDVVKEIISDIHPWKENNRGRKDETAINRFRSGHTLLTLGYLSEGMPAPECEPCHSHAITVKHLLTDCANLASLGLRLFGGSNPNILTKILGGNKVKSNTMKFRKESNIVNRVLCKNE